MPYKNDTDKHVYLNADKTRVVEEGSPEAAFLLVGPGGEVPDADAQKYGLTKQAKQQAPAEDKQVEQPPATKAQTSPPATKGR